MADINRLGVFSQPGSIDIGDDYGKKHNLPERYGGKQFLGTGSKIGKNPDALIDHEFKRISEGDQYVDPGSKERTARAQLKNLNVSEKPFYPSKPSQKSTGPGTQFGCIGSQNEHMNEYDLNEPRELGLGPKNFYTNPAKKGGYGVPGTTIGSREEVLPEPYLVARELDKVARKKAREKIPKPFGATHHTGQTNGLFDKNIYAYEPGDWVPRNDSKNKSVDKAFRPTHPGKKGHNCTIQSFPEYKEDPWDDKQAKERAEAAAERSKKGIFKPNSGPKSRPHSSINPLDVTGPNPVSLVDTLY